MNKKLDTDAVVQFTSTTGQTAASVAAQFGVTKTTASRFLGGLCQSGTLKVSGSVQTGKRGRPQFIYVSGEDNTPTDDNALLVNVLKVEGTMVDVAPGEDSARTFSEAEVKEAIETTGPVDVVYFTKNEN